MIDTLPAHPPRRRLLRFLIPVLIAHGLLLASLPYWPSGSPPATPGVSVILAPIAADSSAPPAPPVAAAAPRAPARTPTPVPAPLPAAPAPVIRTAPPAAPVAAEPKVIDPAPSHPDASPAVAAGGAIPPRQGSEPSATTSNWRDSYRIALRDALARLHHYPPRARRFGLSGEVVVAFTIVRDGNFTDIHLAHSSHAELLDQAALATVRRLGHFRPLPADYSEDSWAVSAPLVYRLD